MERDPRTDPKAGDKLNLIGWTIEVVCVNDTTVDYWRRGGPHVDADLLSFDLGQWRDQMIKHATVVGVAT